MLTFAKERIQVIASQLKKQAFGEKAPLTRWETKEGLYFTPGEAENAGQPWQMFHSERDHWMGPDAHYWFRARFAVPESMAGKPLWLVVRTQIDEWDDAKNPQFLAFLNGAPVQGLDMHHREIALARSAAAGELYTIDLQAYTGTLHAEFRLLAEVVEVVPSVYSLYYDLQVPLWALSRMGEEDAARREIERILNDTVNLLDLRAPLSPAYFESVDKAAAYVRQHLYTEQAGLGEMIATCVGHTHIDVAWWWTVAQTREKVARSFATVLRLMDEYPEYVFMSSQPQLYVFLQERYPELFEQVKRRVAEGRWEAEGGMWLEADCNLTSGESLVRQFLHGKRYFRETFGMESRILWLPDVFGYSAALPQICKRSGIDYFMTTKLSWNQFNKIPCDTFWWQGIDGSRVFTHFVTTSDVGQSPARFFTTYNGKLHPDSILGAWARYQQKDINNDILISYGYGDGGGGPTREMLETGRRMEKGVRGIPKVRQATARQYFDELYERVKDSKWLPAWVGELYFEYHRGTYTSMARNKRANRKSELLLMDVELLSVLAEPKGLAYPTAELDRLWKVVLLNQFHDILPGSSIREVYEVTRAEYEALARDGERLLQERMRALCGQGSGVTVFNTLGFDRDDVVALGETSANWLSGSDGTLHPVQHTDGGAAAYVRGLPPKGYKGYRPVSGTPAKSPFTIGERSIRTPYYDAAFDGDGNLSLLFDRENGRSVLREGASGNVLRMFEDKPIYYDNWDIDIYYTEKYWDLSGITSLKWVADGPVYAALRITRAFSSSTMEQEIRFYAHTRRIDFITRVDWKESQHLLKARFPLDLNTDEATFDIQFGNVTRKTHRNTSWDKARFETCAHKWMDVSEGGYGVSLLNDCKYGHSVDGGVMCLTLIKSGIEPNPTTDQEEHFFTYSLFPHAGTWQEAGTAREAAKLNQPCHGIWGTAEYGAFSFASVDKPNVVLETIKRAEDGRGVILRLYEGENKRTFAKLSLAQTPKSVVECDLLENDERQIEISENGFAFTIKPYEIKTFRVVF